MSVRSSVSAADLPFAWPDGTPVLAGVTFSVGPGRWGLVAGHRGALVVASHDDALLDRLGITRRLELSGGALSVLDA